MVYPMRGTAGASEVLNLSQSHLGHAAHAKQPSQIVDITASRAYVEGDPFVIDAVARGGYRAVLSVPMLKDDALVGVIRVVREHQAGLQSFRSMRRIDARRKNASHAVLTRWPGSTKRPQKKSRGLGHLPWQCAG